MNYGEETLLVRQPGLFSSGFLSEVLQWSTICDNWHTAKCVEYVDLIVRARHRSL